MELEPCDTGFPRGTAKRFAVSIAASRDFT
jgi:hypothetical protein